MKDIPHTENNNNQLPTNEVNADTCKKKVLIAGAAGFIGGHLGKRLKAEGYYVVGVDWKDPEFRTINDFCHTFHKLDLRDLENCLTACEDVEWVYNLAADMGGMGFIQSNHSLIGYNNSMISLNLLEAAHRQGVKRFFYASSACIYPVNLQDNAANTIQLNESMAFPANPQDMYGLEKLYAEEFARYKAHDFPDFEVRIGRFHGIYGPYGTWKGGREKAPAAFCRKAISSNSFFEVWGDGEQNRSFCYVDDAVEGIIRLMNSNCSEPINIGADELISMNEMAKLAMSFANKNLPIKNIPGPEGVRARNSDNTKIKQVLNWAPSISIEKGLKKTFDWIKSEIDKEAASGLSTVNYAQSKIL